jgi:hypothetical protein
MPACLVEDHHNVLVGINRRSEAVQKNLHVFGVGVRQHQREGSVAAGFHRAVEIGERIALIRTTGRALSTRVPPMADPALLADAGLVLEDEPQPLARMCISNRLQLVREPP